MPKNSFVWLTACAIATLARVVQAAPANPLPETDPSSPDAGPVPTSPEPPEATTGESPLPAPPPAAAPAPPVASGALAPPEPPIPLAERQQATARERSWFARPPTAFAVGEGQRQWVATFYGFVEADVINDSTRSYFDSIGSALVARDETYEGRVGRTQFSIRNTRFGLSLQSPIVGGVRGSAVLETDFFGNQPSNASQAAFFDAPTMRIRQAYLRLEDDVLDLWVGQTYYLFGWQNYFFPCSLEFLGLPNQLFGRTTQVRLARRFSTGAVSLDIAVAATSPAQSDSAIPDGNAGLRFSVDHWKGISTPGNTGTTALPLSIGISGTVRQFKVNAFAPPPPQSSNSATGWGLSVDALLPIIPARDADDRGNRLTATASFVVGTGIGDLIGATGGATFPTLPNPALANPPPVYTPDIDEGIVTFDQTGVLHTIDWQSFMAGLQYYLPPTGRVILSANYTQAYSSNMAQLYPRGGAEIELLSHVANLLRYADANVFWDVTPAVRVGASAQVTTTQYVDGETPRNFRYMGQALYVF